MDRRFANGTVNASQSGDGPPLVHVSITRRAEIVQFGEEPTLLPPFSFLCGEFTVTAGREDVRCTVRRLSPQHTSRPEQCSLRLSDVLHTLADMGGTYAEAVDLIHQAGEYNGLSCPVAFDALPQAPSVYALAKKGAQDPDFFGTDRGRDIPVETLPHVMRHGLAF